MPTNTYINRPTHKPQDGKQHVLKLDPAPSRRPPSMSVDNKDSLSLKGKRSASYTSDGKMFSFIVVFCQRTQSQTKYRHLVFLRPLIKATIDNHPNENYPVAMSS